MPGGHVPEAGADGGACFSLERLGGTQLLQLVESCRWADCPGREASTLSHSSLTISMFANKLDMLIIDNGRPPHFLGILFAIPFST